MSILKNEPILSTSMPVEIAIPKADYSSVLAKADFLDQPGIISNSEVGTFLTCERRHYYAFILKLAPKTYGKALQRGLIGHEALAYFYNAIKSGHGIDTVKFGMRKIINQFAMIEDSDLDMLHELMQLLMDYADYYYVRDKEQYEVLKVEEAYTLALTHDYSYGMRLDLLVRDRFTHETVLIDHKFIYDFYSSNQLAMDAQLKKYVGTLRANGIMVHKGIMNQIRYRTRKREPMTPEEKFQREYGVYTVNTEEIRQVMRDQILVSDRITDRKIMSREAASLAAVRNMGRLTCERCPFFELCRSELLGEDISVAIEANYQSNKYVELYEELGGMSND